MWRAEVQESREHDECVVDAFLEAVTDDDGPPSTSKNVRWQ